MKRAKPAGDRPAIEKRVDLWRDAAGLVAYEQYGRLHLEFRGVTLRLSVYEARRSQPDGIEFNCPTKQLVVQPIVSNCVVLRSEEP